MADDQTTETTKVFSVKKTIGTIGALCLHAIALYAVWKDPSQASSVLWPLAAFDAALFGIKKFGPAGKTA